MTSLEKRIQKLRQQPHGVSTDELERILFALGFYFRKGKGSHRCYQHPDLPGFLLTLPYQRALKKGYVTQALRAIDRILELRDDEQQIS